MHEILNDLVTTHWIVSLLSGGIAATFIASWIIEWSSSGTPCGKTMWLACVAFMFLADVVIYAGFRAFQLIEFPPNLLTPANDPDPPALLEAITPREIDTSQIPGLPAEIAKDIGKFRTPALPADLVAKVKNESTLKVFFGSNIGCTSKDSQVILRVAGRDLLVMNRGPKGISIDAKIFGANGEIMAEIKDDEFFTNDSNLFRIERPDPHTLVVYDLQDEKALDVRYLNPHSVRIRGIFRYMNRPPIIFGDGELGVAHNLSVDNDVFLNVP